MARALPLSAAVLPLGLVALACATDAETASEENESGRTHAVITVERSDPASPDTEGSASAVARFVSVPAFTNATRVLGAAGLSVDLPAPDTCLGSDALGGLEPPLASQDPVELVEAGEVTITAGDATTSLVPHAFPTVGAFASGVLYATRDRASAALPPGALYGVTATGSIAMPALRLTADAPVVPHGVEVAGVALRDVAEVRTSLPLDLTWAAGAPGDLLYVELLAYDGSPSVVCTFRDELGEGTIPEGTFTGTGAGRFAVHRTRSHQFETPASASEVRFDFQVGAAVEFSR